jgi:peptide/nickel transport system ATP-binding protein
MGNLLEIRNLITNFYTYEGIVKALNDVSIDIERDITFGLVGESGCGKSVTVRSIMRIIQPPGKIESGQIRFYNDASNSENSVDLLQQSDAYMQKLRGSLISMIFQEPNLALNPVLTIGYQIDESYLFHQKPDMAASVLQGLRNGEYKLGNIRRQYYIWCYQKLSNSRNSVILKTLDKLPFFSNWSKLLQGEARKRSLAILKSLGIPNVERIYSSYPHNLSGGMKQRIVIALALACHPILLIADEATSNLDVTIQAQILELLKELKKNVISSILLITHDLGVVAETCDRAAVMYAGNVCEVADVKDLFDDPQHPYTQALLSSVPKFSQQGKLAVIPGSVPNLVTPPSGCRFHPRCPKSFERCQSETPQLQDQGHRRQVACHLFS